MPDLKQDAVDAAVLERFLAEQSDFVFELQVLQALIGLGFACEHGGSYDDPVTRKPRQFDIRATKDVGPLRVRLAVECKNLHIHCPLLILCVPRRREEAFHQVIYSFQRETSAFVGPALQEHAETISLRGRRSVYLPGEPVGKSCAQVGVERKSGNVWASDAEIFEKWSQAIHSASDLAYQAGSDAEREGEAHFFSVVFPLVVVPDSTLWVVDFTADGVKLVPPRPADQCPFFVDRSFLAGDLTGPELKISHLDFVTLQGLTKWTQSLFSEDSADDMVEAAIEVQRKKAKKSSM